MEKARLRLCFFFFGDPKSSKSLIKIGRMYKKSDTLLDNLTKQ